MKILIAEDEVSIAKALKVMLEKNKYTVDITHDGTEAYEFVMAGHYDVLVLDIMMPGMDGITLLKALREKGVTTPTLFLTAKAEVEDRIAGLDAGADDYLAKPFASGEFLARVRALVRRSGSYVSSTITVGNTTLDTNRYLLLTTGREERLNNKEFQLMEVFMRSPGQVFPVDQLMEKVWGLDSESEQDVVWTYIGFLRRKLRSLHADIEIRTIRGAGYALEKAAVLNG